MNISYCIYVSCMSSTVISAAVTCEKIYTTCDPVSTLSYVGCLLDHAGKKMNGQQCLPLKTKKQSVYIFMKLHLGSQCSAK